MKVPLRSRPGAVMPKEVGCAGLGGGQAKVATIWGRSTEVRMPGGAAQT